MLAWRYKEAPPLLQEIKQRRRSRANSGRHSEAAAKQNAMTGYTEQAKGRKRRTKGEMAALEASRILAILRRESTFQHRPHHLLSASFRWASRQDRPPISQSSTGLGRCGPSGRLPYSWIVDSSSDRLTTFQPTTASKNFRSAWRNWYRSDVWSNVPQHVEVWCESRSLAGMLRPVCDELGVSLVPYEGFKSMSQVWSAAQEMAATGKPSPPYCSTLAITTPAAHISEDSKGQAWGHLAGTRHAPHFRRLAVNLDQIERYRLAYAPAQGGEKRKASMSETVEAEALEPGDFAGDSARGRPCLSPAVGAGSRPHCRRIGAGAHSTIRRRLKGLGGFIDHDR